MDIFNKERIKQLEEEVAAYKSINKQLECYKKRCEDAELKVKCLQMYVDDDEAIDELLAVMTVKLSHGHGFGGSLGGLGGSLGGLGLQNAAGIGTGQSVMMRLLR